MSGYVLGEEKTFNTFVKGEKVIDKRIVPLMSDFAEEEKNFWLKTAEEHLKPKDKIIEMGCGSGRIMKKLSQAGFSVYGFDNNRLLVKHCQNRGLNAFYSDARSNISKEEKGRYGMAGIAWNTLFNFSGKERLKWISSAYNLLAKNGVLVITAYADNDEARKSIKQRINFYNSFLDAPEGYSVEFFEKRNKRGIHFLNDKREEICFSLWKTKKELLKETASWTGFKLQLIELMNCKIAWNVLLLKK